MNSARDIPRVLTIPEVAARYHLPVYAVRTWVKSGALPVVRAGRKSFINSAVLEEFLRGEPVTAPKQTGGGYGTIRRVV